MCVMEGVGWVWGSGSGVEEVGTEDGVKMWRYGGGGVHGVGGVEVNQHAWKN